MDPVNETLQALRKETPFDNEALFDSIEPHIPELVAQMDRRRMLDLLVDPSGLYIVVSDFAVYLHHSEYDGPISRQAMADKVGELYMFAKDSSTVLGRSREQWLFLDSESSPLNIHAQWFYARRQLTYHRLLITNPSAYLPKP